MNYIVLEGASLYLVVALVIILIILCLSCLAYVILCDKKNFTLENLVAVKNEEIKDLNRLNLMLKIKCGEFDIDEA